MSEYLSKKAVLGWLDDRRYKSPWIESFREHLESGAFDADGSEVQRLRAALEEIRDHAIRFGLATVHMKAEKALSTTTEPINAEKAERVRGGDGNDA